MYVKGTTFRVLLDSKYRPGTPYFNTPGVRVLNVPITSVTIGAGAGAMDKKAATNYESLRVKFYSNLNRNKLKNKN